MKHKHPTRHKHVDIDAYIIYKISKLRIKIYKYITIEQFVSLPKNSKTRYKYNSL